MASFAHRLALPALLAALSVLYACASPDALGVQDRGQIVGRIYNAKTQQAVTSGTVAVGSVDANSQIGPNGEFAITAPIGQQTLTVIAAGYDPYNVDVIVTKNQATSLTVPLNPTGS